MEFSLDHRTCALSIGEFADFTLGPRASGRGGPSGLWRAQLGQEWHAALRRQTEAEVKSRRGGGTRADAAFEVPIELPSVHRGWLFAFSGRIDQIVTTFTLPASSDAPGVSVVLREIKTVPGPLPADEAGLRAEYPEYFLQASAYLALARSAPRSPAQSAAGIRTPADDAGTAAAVWSAGAPALSAELVFVELGTGITQAVPLTADDDRNFLAQLERLVEFLNLRLRARERLRSLRYHPAFPTLRPGQESIQDGLLSAFGETAQPEAGGAGARSAPVSPADRRRTSILLFEAPTGYGKTGVRLEFALGRLKAGRFERLLYLTGKSTGQIQVMRTLSAMTAGECGARSPGPAGAGAPAGSVAAWQLRPKSEHCVNPVFHCVRDACPYLADPEGRWARSGLARFYLTEGAPRDLDSVRIAGREAGVCPYEITRAALPFNDVWIGDYNYVFSPDSRGIFFDRPGFIPAETLLVVDEAHNLPSRVADAWSHVARAGDAEAVMAELHRVRAPSPLLLAWEHWTRLLAGLRHSDGLDLATEDDVRDTVNRLAASVASTPLDYAALGPAISEQLWRVPALRDWLAGEFTAPPGEKPTGADAAGAVRTLLWSPRAGELHFTCLDAAPLVGRVLRAFGGAILASATLEPAGVFSASCGLGESPAALLQPGRIAPPAALGKLSRRARRTLRGLTSGAELLKVEEARELVAPGVLHAPAPWRDAAYSVGVDTRVDTTFQHRTRFFDLTAATVAAMCGSVGGIPGAGTVAVFFPSYAYAESILHALASGPSGPPVALQPRGADLTTLAAWVEESLAHPGALFLVLGSSFAESIDLLGGRVTSAMVVGPALPEVNAIQRSRLAELERDGLSRTEAFHRVYQIPGMQKVNQALGRLVRAPGQRARVLLHCRRFAEPSYSALLAPEYRSGTAIRDDSGLEAWLRRA